MFCVRCGHYRIAKTANNRQVADFICPRCGNIFELKSKSGNFGKSIIDGDYRTMISKVTTKTNPDFFLLSYDSDNYRVNYLAAIPRHFFIPSMIEKRTPLPETARRAGWVGCNILINQLPPSGKVEVIQTGKWRVKEKVLSDFNRAAFLEEKSINNREWIIDVMNCINRIPHNEFSLSDVYQFEKELGVKHPNNNNIRPKIRQQLQVLRDKGIISFESRGQYKKL